MVAQHEDDGGGLAWRRCSEEQRAAPTCPAPRGRIWGEDGCGQSRVEGLGAALIGGGGRRRGLDEIWRGGRAPAPGNWLNELSGVQGCAWSRGGVLTGKGMAGAVGALLWSRRTEEEDRRGWWASGAGGATWRKEEGRPGFGHAMRRRTVWGAWRWQGRAAGGGGRQSSSAREAGN
jgi:hypothetical protein